MSAIPSYPHKIITYYLLCLSHSMPQIIVPTHNPTVNKNSILYSFHIHEIECIKISYYALDDWLILRDDADDRAFVFIYRTVQMKVSIAKLVIVYFLFITKPLDCYFISFLGEFDMLFECFPAGRRLLR